MFNVEQRRAAIELLVKYDRRYAEVIGELGYPDRQTLRSWWEAYEATGEVPEGYRRRKAGFSGEEKRAAVDHYLEHGRSAAGAVRALGYPSRATLAAWVDELAPGRRATRPGRPGPEARAAAVAALASGAASAEEVAAGAGVAVGTLYNWCVRILGEGVPGDMGDAGEGSPGELEAQVARLRAEVRALRLQKAVLEGVLDTVKKDPGTDPKRLTNGEKARLVNSLRAEGWRLGELLGALGMAKSSYEYAARALGRGEAPGRAAAREAVVAAYGEGGGACGYRRVLGAVNASGPRVGEWTVRAIMREEGLAGKTPRRRRRYDSYEGETSAAPANLLRREDGTHDFRADRPNATWVTDVTEFRIPAGKVYLSPVIDCFDGMPLGWAISTSPDAEMANSSLLAACRWLREGDRPRVHTDRGCHYRWPGWARICEERGLVRSMSRKGCSPDNARAEGFFGRLKVEFFYGVDWEGVGLERFMELLDAYLVWYRDERAKSDLGNRSPMQYRRDLGLLSA